MKTLLLAILLAATAITSPASFAESSGRTLVPGIDYTEIENGKPLDPADGKVVVEEFFNYICPACDHFEPLFASWAARLPPWVKVAHVPAAFSAGFHEYAKAYYAADALGLVDKTHEAVYNAIHNTHKLPGEGQKVDDKAIAAFYANYGVSADKFLSTMNSFSVDSQVRRATDHLKACKVMSTPSLVIDGRYLVKGRNYNDMLWIARALIEKEHRRMTSATH